MANIDDELKKIRHELSTLLMENEGQGADPVANMVKDSGVTGNAANRVIDAGQTVNSIVNSNEESAWDLMSYKFADTMADLGEGNIGTAFSKGWNMVRIAFGGEYEDKYPEEDTNVPSERDAIRAARRNRNRYQKQKLKEAELEELKQKNGAIMQKIAANKSLLIKYGAIMCALGLLIGGIRYSSIKNNAKEILKGATFSDKLIAALSVVADLTVAFIPLCLGALILWYGISEGLPEPGSYHEKILSCAITVGLWFEKTMHDFLYPNKVQASINRIAQLSELQLSVANAIDELSRK